ncbi:MAG: hypothetical protein ACYTHK_00400 [Planctomycetota bacterium]
MRALVALLLLAIPAAGQPFERWLPAKTVLYFAVENANVLRVRLARGPLPAIFARPEARGSLDALRAFLAGRGADPEATWSLLAHPTGQVVIALWEKESEEFDVDGALLADVRDAERPFLRSWNMLLRMEERDHAVVLGEEVASGIKIHTREFRARGETTRSAWFLDGGVFGFAPSADALRRLLAQRQAAGSSFEADERFRRFRRSVSGDVSLYVSGRLWSARAAPALQPMLAAAGFDNLRGVGMRLSFVPDGVYSRVLLDIDGPRRGLLRMFRPAVRGLAPPAWLPLRTEAAAVLHLDHKKLLRHMLAASDAVHPGFARLLEEETARISREKGVDMRRELLSALGPRTTLALLPLSARMRRVADSRGMDHALFGLALIQEVKSKPAMERVLKAGLSMLGPVPSREIEGVRVYLVPGRDGGAAAIIDDHLVLTRHIDLVRTLIDRRGGILQGAAYTRARRYAPEKCAAFSFLAPRPPPAFPIEAADERTRRLLRAAGHRPVAWWRRYHDLSVFSLTDAGDGLLLSWFTGLRRPPQTAAEK